MKTVQIRTMTTADAYPEIIEFDKVITGTNREKMLIRLFP